jgi:hypothetical protein
MSLEIPTTEIRTFRNLGFIAFTDLIPESDRTLIQKNIKSKKTGLPDYAHKNLCVSDFAELKKILKKRGIGQIAAQLMSAKTIRVTKHLYYDSWQEIEALEVRRNLTPEEMEEKEKHAPRTPLTCHFALSLSEGWGCFFKKFAPSAKELFLPTEGSFYFFDLSSHPLDEQRAPLIYG